MKYHIEKNSVQETLVIPLYGRKKCSELYPDLFQDETAVRLIGQIDYDFSALERKAGSLMQGFAQGKKDGCKEWPIPGESLFTYRGKPLPYMPFCYQHPQYWHVFASGGKRTGDMMNSCKIFDDSEAAHPIQEEEFIPIEHIRGKLLMIGAADDTLWDAAKYIRRMEQHLAERPHSCAVEAAVYEHGTHFVFPQSMLTTMLPIGADLFVKRAFRAAKQYPKECRAAR